MRRIETLTLKGISKSFRDVHANRNIDPYANRHADTLAYPNVNPLAYANRNTVQGCHR